MFLWEGATSSLRTCLDMALESLRSAPIMVLLKDFVMLMCLALTGCGFPTAVVQVCGEAGTPATISLLYWLPNISRSSALSVVRGTSVAPDRAAVAIRPQHKRGLHQVSSAHHRLSPAVALTAFPTHLCHCSGSVESQSPPIP